MARASTTVLVVDDEDDVRGLLRRRLESAGYTAIEADGPKSALRVLDKTKVDVLLTDVLMPERSGVGLIQDVRRTHPGVRVVAMSGAFEPEDVARLVDVHVLPKPFTSEQLIHAVEGADSRARRLLRKLVSVFR